MAGVSRLQYTTDIRLIRVMCSGRVDLEFILRAFTNGMDGVFIGGCRLNECNYITQGNYDALSNVFLFRKLMEKLGLNPERLRVEFMSAGEGNVLVEVVNDFGNKIERIGPLGKSEGIEESSLKLKLDAVNRLIPYIKLVERERLRAPVKTIEAYNEFLASEDVNKLFNELIGDKLAISQIMSLLQEKPLPTAEIAEILGLKPSEVARHMNTSSRQKLAKYDESLKCYALA